MKKFLPTLVAVLLLCGCSYKDPAVSTSPSGSVSKPAPVSILVRKSDTSLCVTAEVLTLRTGPAISYQPITWLTRGARITRLSSVGNWLEVTSSQYRGWVNSKFTGDCP